MAQPKRIRLGTMRLWVRSLTSLSGLRIHHCCELWVGHRRGSDPALLWLCCGPTAIPSTRLIAWETSYDVGAAPGGKQNAPGGCKICCFEFSRIASVWRRRSLGALPCSPSPGRLDERIRSLPPHPRTACLPRFCSLLKNLFSGSSRCGAVVNESE